jgi:hypothetical protein
VERHADLLQVSGGSGCLEGTCEDGRVTSSRCCRNVFHPRFLQLQQWLEVCSCRTGRGVPPAPGEAAVTLGWGPGASQGTRVPAHPLLLAGACCLAGLQRWQPCSQETMCRVAGIDWCLGAAGVVPGACTGAREATPPGSFKHMRTVAAAAGWQPCSQASVTSCLCPLCFQLLTGVRGLARQGP